MKRRLLLIDDAPDNLEFLSILLSDKYDVYSYGSCTEAIVAVKHIKPDLLLLDIRMFPINGVDFLKEVRAMQGFNNIPAIAVTALARDAEKKEFVAAGFQAIVTKPILDLPSMEAVVDGLLKSTAPAEGGKTLDGDYSMTA